MSDTYIYIAQIYANVLAYLLLTFLPHYGMLLGKSDTPVVLHRAIIKSFTLNGNTSSIN